jgi:hypothetical protein
VTTEIPDGHRDLFEQPALGQVTYLDDRGRLITFPMWVELAGGRVLTSSPVGSRKGRALRQRPQVGIAIVAVANPWHWLSLSGRVVDIRPDTDLEFIDRMSHKYTGSPYPRRTPREVFEIEIERLTASGG